MKIRKATREDVQAIKDLYWLLDTDAVFYQPNAFVRTERPAGFILDIINSEKSDFLLIEADKKVIGFALLQEKKTPDISCLIKKNYVHVLDLVIAEEYRSKGYGGALLEASKEWGRERGLDLLRLSVFSEKHRAISFYLNHGLRPSMLTMECELK